MDKVTGIFSKKKVQDTRIALPDIAPLTSSAGIDDIWEAVEKFPECLLLTDPILADETESYTVKQVVFNLKSNDQGWCNEDNFEGEYEGSWTWFEVAILRPVQVGDRVPPRDKRSITSEPCIKKTLDEKNISTRLCFVISENGTGPFWHLQRNRRGKGDPFTHTITWKPDSEESESERFGWDFDAKTGAGSGADFVPSLQKGDRVAIIARAKQSGSVNYILEAKIQIDFEGFKPADDALTTGSNQDLANAAQPNTTARSDVSRSSSAMALGDSASGVPRTSSSTFKSSNARHDESLTQPRVSSPLPGVPRPTASPLPTESSIDNNDNVNPSQATESAQQGRIKVSIPSNAGPSGSNNGTKSPASPSRKGSTGSSGRWNLRLPLGGGKKKSNSDLKSKPPTANSTQPLSGRQSNDSNPIIEVNGQEAPPIVGDSSASAQSSMPTSPSSPTGERPKSLLGGWGDKVKHKIKRGKTSSSLGAELGKIDDSDAGGDA